MTLYREHNNSVSPLGMCRYIYPCIFNARRACARELQYSLCVCMCVCVCVCVSPVCWRHNRFIQAFEPYNRLFTEFSQFSTYGFLQNSFFWQLKRFPCFQHCHTAAILTTRPRSNFNVTTLYLERNNSAWSTRHVQCSAVVCTCWSCSCSIDLVYGFVLCIPLIS